jgi:hypothetical protein
VIDLDALIAKTRPDAHPRLDLDALIARVTAPPLPDPAPWVALRSTGERAYRVRLRPAELSALVLLVGKPYAGEAGAFHAATIALVRRVLPTRADLRRPGADAATAALGEAGRLNLVGVSRISGSGDYDVVFAADLLPAIRVAARAAQQTPASDRDPWFPDRAQLDALLGALSPAGLPARRYPAGSRARRE